MQENEQVEKEIIEGYEIQYSMKVGGKRFAFGIHMDPSHKDRYFEGIITTNEIFVNYEGYASDDYFEIMHRLIDNMAKELESMEQKRAAQAVGQTNKRMHVCPMHSSHFSKHHLGASQKRRLSGPIPKPLSQDLQV